jgi:hypothetical protein
MRLEHVLLHVDVAGGHEVVERAQTGVEGDVLEGAGQAQGSDGVGRRLGQVGLAFEEDAPFLRPIEAADAVEDGGLARAVGADDGADFAGVHVEADAGQRGVRSEVERYVFNTEDSCASIHAPLVTEQWLTRAEKYHSSTPQARNSLTECYPGSICGFGRRGW